MTEDVLNTNLQGTITSTKGVHIQSVNYSLRLQLKMHLGPGIQSRQHKCITKTARKEMLISQLRI